MAAFEEGGSQVSFEEVKDRFHCHPVEDDTVRADRQSVVRSVLLDTAYELLQVIPPGRELALVLTKLEEAMFWGQAGIARDG